MLLLIDAPGSMGDPIGSGNSQVKIEAAERAAIAALGRAETGDSVEVAVLAFSGDGRNPVPRYQDFTRDVGQATATLQSGGVIFRHETVRFGIAPSRKDPISSNLMPGNTTSRFCRVRVWRPGVPISVCWAERTMRTRQSAMFPNRDLRRSQ